MSGVEAARNNATGVQQNQLLKVNPVVPAVRRSSVARPSLPTVHSGVAMDSQDFSDVKYHFYYYYDAHANEFLK